MRLNDARKQSRGWIVTQVSLVTLASLAIALALILMGCGRPPEDTSQEPANTDEIDEKPYIELRYGDDIASGAEAAAQILTQAGYDVVDGANANNCILSETLIVYREGDSIEWARDIRGKLGVGRLIPNNGRFVFDGSDILVLYVDDLASDHLSESAYGCFVTVLNGYGIDGSARGVAMELANTGYQILSIDSAVAYIYEETLIVYRSEDDVSQAERIQTQLGYGRLHPAMDRYDFEGDVLVVVGSEYHAEEG
jgi:hypothetical protein